MISVIIPVYNAEKYIGQCIQSVLNQTYTNLELILINDGSTDKSDVICRKYAEEDERIVYISKPNEGVGSTRNLGMTIAKGDWICFIDADDEVTPNYLEAFHIDATEADLIYTGIRVINVADSTVIKTIEFEDNLLNDEYLSAGVKNLLTIGFPVGKAYRKSIIEKSPTLKFPTDISFHEDHVFIFDYLLRCNSIETHADVTYIYKIDYSAASLSRKRHRSEDLMNSSEYMFQRIMQLKDRFNLEDADLIEINNFAFSPLISGIESAYNDRREKKELYNILHHTINGNRPMRSYFHPIDKKGKFLKFICCFMPLPIIHIFFKALTLYHMR